MRAIGGRKGLVNEPRRSNRVQALSSTADRLDELADTADLMGDDVGSTSLRAEAARRRAEGLALLDDDAAPAPTDPAP